MQVPASIIRMSFSGFSMLAPTAAAKRSEPRVCGVLYLLQMGMGVSGVKRRIGKGILFNAFSTASGMPITDPTMPRSKWYLLANAGSAASVSLFVFISSMGSSPSKATSLATVLPISIINFTGAKVRLSERKAKENYVFLFFPERKYFRLGVKGTLFN